MRYIITHGHIFKNAGTTFDYALKKAFGKDFCDHRDDISMRRGRADYLKQFILDNPNLKAVSSHHLCNPLPISKEFTCIPVFFLRNPIERIISVYNFERKQKHGTIGAEMASKLNLLDYVKWRMQPDIPKVIFNYQTLYIGSEKNSPPQQQVSANVFLHAIERINANNILIGVVERFDQSFSLISDSLSKFFPDHKFHYKKKNINDSNSNQEKYNNALARLQPLLTECIDKNAFDIALHNLANQKIDDSIARSNNFIGPS